MPQEAWRAKAGGNNRRQQPVAFALDDLIALAAHRLQNGSIQQAIVAHQRDLGRFTILHHVEQRHDRGQGKAGYARSVPGSEMPCPRDRSARSRCAAPHSSSSSGSAARSVRRRAGFNASEGVVEPRRRKGLIHGAAARVG